VSESSTGLSSPTAAALAYSGWWISGGILWFVERRDSFVRRHAAQALTVFGLISLIILALIVLAVGALTFMPAAFAALMVAAGIVWIGGVVLWAIAMWRAINGEEWGLGAWVLERVGAQVPVLRFTVPEHPST
jgi:uncharacterized membrane protein